MLCNNTTSTESSYYFTMLRIAQLFYIKLYYIECYYVLLQ